MISFEKTDPRGARAIIKEVINRARGLVLEYYEGPANLKPDLWQGYRTSAFPKVICETKHFTTSDFDLLNSIFHQCESLINEYNPDEFILVIQRELSQKTRDTLYEHFNRFKRTKFSLLDLTDLDNIIESFEDLKYVFKNFQKEEKTKSKNKARRYWAGGFGRGEIFYERLEDFKTNNYWQALDYDEDSNQVIAENAWALFREIKIGDGFLIKGYGAGNIRVHYVGEVTGKNEEMGRLELRRKNVRLYRGQAPGGEGAGNWFNTILEVKREKDIQLLFYQPEVPDIGDDSEENNDFSKDDFNNDFKTGTPESTIVSNNFSYANVSHDQATDSKDLLGFEKDVRSFASIMTLKEVKPPLAIALFGNWGTGKSFFMNGLQKEITYLSKNQSFPGMKSKQGENIFCDGILQIQFNAWSYLDANLWAGLVANIFEKIDEYISEKTKGENEKQKVREILNEKLEIIATNKKVINESVNELENKKANISLEIETLRKKQNKLIEDIAGQTWEDISKEILKKIKLEPAVEEQLKAYGITEDKLNVLSPNAIYSEFKSWSTFVKNIFKLSKISILVLSITILILLIVAINPNNICDDVFKICSRSIIAFLSIAGPIFAGLYITYEKFKKLIHPLTKFKDEFNQKIAEAKFNYEQKVGLLNAQERQIETEIKTKTSELEILDEQIEEVTYELKHSVTKRAFTNFVKAKAKDEKYEKHLGIISTIRRDFETLSELFIENSGEKSAIEVSEKKVLEKKEVYKTLKDQFDKPLNRIILYIDDLDRCSEEKVLEVLQAVHLIMAFPLFIVVVGVDKRCVNNALNFKNLSQYKGLPVEKDKTLKSYGIEPIEPNEYLEKIFQIPFHIKETSDEAVENMIDSLLSGQVKWEDLKIENGDFNKESFTQELPKKDYGVIQEEMKKNLENFKKEMGLPNEEAIKKEEPISVENLTLTGIEFKYLKEISFMVGKTPRTVKRFLNLYRIVRAHEGLSYSKENRNEEFKIIMFLLALFNGPYGSFSREFIEHLRMAEILESDPIDATLEGLFETKLSENPLDEAYNYLHDKLKNSNFKTLMSIPPDKFLNYLPFIQRFSFN